jgi:hypothetical protein
MPLPKVPVKPTTKNGTKPAQKGLLNWTTDVEVTQTVQEIQRYLVNAGAKRVLTDFDDDGEPCAVAFQIPVNGDVLAFQMPINVEGTLQVLKQQAEEFPRIKAAANRPQAARIAWRTVQDWIEAQLALIEAGQATLEGVMLPHMLVAPGLTLYEAMQRGHYALPEAVRAIAALPESSNGKH